MYLAQEPIANLVVALSAPGRTGEPFWQGRIL